MAASIIRPISTKKTWLRVSLDQFQLKRHGCEYHLTNFNLKKHGCKYHLTNFNQKTWLRVFSAMTGKPALDG